MVTTLITTQIILVLMVLLIIIVFQKTNNMGLGAYSGSNDTVFGAKGPGSFLNKLTFSIIILFFMNTIYLGYTLNEEGNKSIIDNMDTINNNQSMILNNNLSMEESYTPTSYVEPVDVSRTKNITSIEEMKTDLIESSEKGELNRETDKKIVIDLEGGK